MDLELPEVQPLTSCSINSEFYGASFVAAWYCGYPEPPKTPRGYWAHGWNFKHVQQWDIPVLCGGKHDLHGKRDYHWVGRSDEVDFLHRHGYKNVKAIGLPFAYVRPTQTVRRPGSLLVMPSHSLDNTTHDWKCEEYADQISQLRSSFSEVWACVHPSCWKHGYWVSAFRKRGFPVVQGALYTDRNALERLYRLLSRFEYVTTNALGSHVAYAAYLGVKVSIYGRYAELDVSDWRGYPEYDDCDRLIDAWNEAYSEKMVRQHYPELFCHPLEAPQRIEWGRQQVGLENKVTPAELRRLFGWTPQGRLADSGKRLLRKVRQKASLCVNAVAPYRLLHQSRMWRSAEYRRKHEIDLEFQRLQRLSPYTVTSTNLLGGNFALVDAKSFLAQYKAIFGQQIYRFHSRKEKPLIIDGGANVGLSVLYFKRSYPKSRIIAFEPDPDLFQVLGKNCAAFQLHDVELVPKALWTEEAMVKFDREGADAGRILKDTESSQAGNVSTCRLRDYLDQEIDLLKLDLEGAEVDVLLDCADRLGNVEKIVIEYHSFQAEPQKLQVLTQILHDAGFRLHVTPGLVSQQPLWWRQILQNMDMRLYLYGFRS